MVNNQANEKENKKSILSKEWFKILIIASISFLIAIVGTLNNIEKERQRVFTSMKSKIKSEVEKELYGELMDKFKDRVKIDLKKEYRDFVKLELQDNLKDDIFRSVKHQIDSEGGDLFYEVFESIEYKERGDSIHRCDVIVRNLDSVFEDELEGLYKQIFGKYSDKKGVLLVFGGEPEESGYTPKFRLENGLNDEVLIIHDGNKSDLADNGRIY